MKAVALALLVLALPARAQEGVLVSDAPKRVLMPDGSQVWNKAAATAIDNEFKRLQQIEADAEAEQKRLAENGVKFSLLALGIGVTLGIAGGVVIGLAVRR